MNRTKIALLRYFSYISGLLSVTVTVQPAPSNLARFKNSTISDNINSYGKSIHVYA